MTDVGEVRYKARVDTSSVDEDSKKAEQAVKKASEKVEDTAEDTGKKVRDESKKTKKRTESDSKESSEKFAVNWKKAGVTAAKAIGSAGVAIGTAAATGIAALGKVGVEYNAQMEKYAIALTTALGNEAEAATALEKIKDDAARTPYDVSGLIQANMFLVSAGESAESARATINALGEAVSATGGGADELNRMAQNLQQIKNAGEATAADIKQFAYAGIDVYGILADYTGKTTEEIKDMNVSYEDLSAALRAASEEGGRYYGANEKQAQSLAGRFSTLKDNFFAFTGEVTEGVTPALTAAMDAISALFEDGTLKSALTDIFDGLSKIAVEALPVFVDLINELAPAMGGIVEELLPIFFTLLESLLPVVMQLVEAVLPVISEILLMLVPPLAQIVEAIMPALVTVIDALMPILSIVLEQLAVLLNTVVELLQPFMDLIISGIAPLIDVIAGLISFAITPLSEYMKILLSVVVSVFNGIKDTALTVVNAVTGLLQGLINFIAGVFTGNWQRAWEGISQILGSIAQGFVALVKFPINTIIDLINGFINGVNNIRIPSWVPGIGGMGISLPLIPRLKKGMPFVPKDFFPAYLDYGERVLTREENAMLNSIGGFSVVQQAAQAMTSNAVPASGGLSSARIEVPVVIDGREVARASAWYMGEQLSWEER